jgi:hypothetical protein
VNRTADSLQPRAWTADPDLEASSAAAATP